MTAATFPPAPPARGGAGDDAPRILIIRLSAIGDVIFSTSLLPALRARWPDALISWLTTPLGEELLHGHPLLDEILVLPASVRRGRLPAALGDGWRLARALRRRQFTLAIDAQGLLKSAVWAAACGAPRRVGLRPREGAHLLYTERVDAALDTPPDRPAREYRRLAAHLGLAIEPFPMSLAPPGGPGAPGAIAPPEAIAVPHVIGAPAATVPGAAPGTGPVCLLPFTTRPQKHWFDERWSALADRLHDAGFGPLLILGGPDDAPQAQRIAEGARAPVQVIAGPTSNLREKREVLAVAALAIGVDTGLTHMSIALGRPTLALFGSTCPYVRTDPTLGVVLYENLDCAPCRRHPTCDGRFDCMRAHTVERVLAAATTLLAASAADAVD